MSLQIIHIPEIVNAISGDRGQALFIHIGTSALKLVANTAPVSLESFGMYLKLRPHELPCLDYGIFDHLFLITFVNHYSFKP
jgi:hypothetical protein